MNDKEPDSSVRARTAGAASRAARRVRNNAWPILQQSLAAVVAWLIATHLSAGHIPFFAPIAAVVALNARMGGRGRQAFRLLLGVTVGILVGVEAIQLFGNRTVALPIAVLAAMLCAAAVGGTRVTLAQSAAGAVLTVVIPYGGGGGFPRLFDALIGVGVALVFSQVLFTPQPLRMLRLAESAALQQMSQGLEATVMAMRGETKSAERALQILRAVRRELDDVGFVQTAVLDVTRRSLLRRHQRELSVQESEVATQLQYLGPDCLTVARISLALDPADREPLSAVISSIAEAFQVLADDPASLGVRAGAARQLSAASAQLADAPADSHSDALRVAVAVTELLVIDALIFCGVRSSSAEGG